MKFKLDSNQIIVFLIAFLIGIGVTSFLRSDKGDTDQMGEEVMEEAMVEEAEGSGDTAPSTSNGASSAGTTTTPFVSGKCSTGLSGYKDNKLNAIVLNWSPCSSGEFQFYKLVKSSKNSNPSYPSDPVAFSSANKNAANFVDRTVAARTTYYYRMCVVQRLNHVNCSGVATVSY